jgi:hypothetical protein
MKILRTICHFGVENFFYIISTAYVTLSAVLLACIASVATTTMWYHYFHERSWTVAAITAVTVLIVFFWRFSTKPKPS